MVSYISKWAKCHSKYPCKQKLWRSFIIVMIVGACQNNCICISFAYPGSSQCTCLTFMLFLSFLTISLPSYQYLHVQKFLAAFGTPVSNLGYTHVSIIFLSAFSVTQICQLKIIFWKPNLVKIFQITLESLLGVLDCFHLYAIGYCFHSNDKSNCGRGPGSQHTAESQCSKPEGTMKKDIPSPSPVPT